MIPKTIFARADYLTKAGVGYVFKGVGYEHVNYGVEVASGGFVNSELLIGGGAAFEDGVDVFNFFSRAERFNYVVNEIEQFADKVLYRDLFLLAEVRTDA